MFKKSLHTVKRFTAWGILTCFCMSDIFTPVPRLFASTVTEPAFAPPLAEIELPAALGTLDKQMASIRDLKDDSGPAPLILHIQTAHGNYDAQKKIQAILELLLKEHDIDLLLLEGAGVKLDPWMDRYFKNGDWNRAIADFRARRGRASGASLFLLDHPDIPTHGIESIDAYRTNRLAFKHLLMYRSQVQAFLEHYERDLSKLASHVLSKPLREFLRKNESFKKEKTPIATWLDQLKDQTRKVLKIDISDAGYQKEWPALTRIFQLRELEEQIDFNSLKDEKKAFLDSIEKRIDEDLFKDLTGFLNQDPRKITQLAGQGYSYAEVRFLFERLLDQINDSQSQKSEYFPSQNFKLFIRFLVFQNEIKPEGLFEETERLTRKVLKTMTIKQEEALFLELKSDFELFRKLLLLELVPEDFDDIEKGEKDIVPASMIERLRSFGYRTRSQSLPEPVLKKLETIYEVSLGFYEGAKAREPLMAANIEARMKDQEAKVAVLITGGFHVKGLSRALKKKGFSYALITPRIDELESRTNYFTSFLDKAPLLFASSYIEDTNTLPPVPDPQVLARHGVDVRSLEMNRIESILRGAPVPSGLPLEEFNRSVFARRFGTRLDRQSNGDMVLNSRLNGVWVYDRNTQAFHRAASDPLASEDSVLRNELRTVTTEFLAYLSARDMHYHLQEDGEIELIPAKQAAETVLKALAEPDAQIVDGFDFEYAGPGRDENTVLIRDLKGDVHAGLAAREQARWHRIEIDETVYGLYQPEAPAKPEALLITWTGGLFEADTGGQLIDFFNSQMRELGVSALSHAPSRRVKVNVRGNDLPVFIDITSFDNVVEGFKQIAKRMDARNELRNGDEDRLFFENSRLYELQRLWDGRLVDYRDEAEDLIGRLTPEGGLEPWRQLVPHSMSILTSRLIQNSSRGVPTALVAVGTSGVAKTSIADELVEIARNEQTLLDAGLSSVEALSGDYFRLEAPNENFRLREEEETIGTIKRELAKVYQERLASYREALKAQAGRLTRREKEDEVRQALADFERFNTRLRLAGFQPFDPETGEISRDAVDQFDWARMNAFWQRLKDANASQPFRQREYIPIFDTGSRGRIRIRLGHNNRIQVMFRARGPELLAEIVEKRGKKGKQRNPYELVYREGEVTLDEDEMKLRSQVVRRGVEVDRSLGLQVAPIKSRRKIVGRRNRKGYRITVDGAVHEVYIIRKRQSDGSYENQLHVFYEGVSEPEVLNVDDRTPVLKKPAYDAQSLIVFEWMLALGLETSYFDDILFLDADPWVRLLRQIPRYTAREGGATFEEFMLHRQTAWRDEDRLIYQGLAEAEKKATENPAAPEQPGYQRHPLPLTGLTERREETLFRLARNRQLLDENVARNINSSFDFLPEDFGKDFLQPDFSAAAEIQDDLDEIVSDVVFQELARRGSQGKEQIRTEAGMMSVSFGDYLVKFDDNQTNSDGFHELTEDQIEHMTRIKVKGDAAFDPFTIIDFKGTSIHVTRQDGTVEERKLGRVVVQARGAWKSLKNHLDFLATAHQHALLSGRREKAQDIEAEVGTLLRKAVQNDMHMARLGFVNPSPERNLATKEISPEGNPVQASFFRILTGDAAQLAFAPEKYLEILTTEDERYKLPDAFHNLYKQIVADEIPKSIKEFQDDYLNNPFDAEIPVPNIMTLRIGVRQRAYLGKLILRSKVRQLKDRLRHTAPGETDVQGWGKVIQWTYFFKEGILPPDSVAKEALNNVYEDIQQRDYFDGHLDREGYKQNIIAHFPELQEENSLDRAYIDVFFDSLPRILYADGILIAQSGPLYRKANAVKKLFDDTYGRFFESQEDFDRVFTEIYERDLAVLAARETSQTAAGTFSAYIDLLNTRFRENILSAGERIITTHTTEPADGGDIVIGAYTPVLDEQDYVSEDAYVDALRLSEQVNPGSQDFIQALVAAGKVVATQSDQPAGVGREEYLREGIEADFPHLFDSAGIILSSQLGVQKTLWQGPEALERAITFFNHRGIDTDKIAFISPDEKISRYALSAGIEQIFTYDYARHGRLGDTIIVLNPPAPQAAEVVPTGSRDELRSQGLLALADIEERRSRLRNPDRTIARFAAEVQADVYLPEDLLFFPGSFRVPEPSVSEIFKSKEWAREALGIKSGEAYILDPQFALDLGGLAFAREIFGDKPVAVWVRNQADAEFIQTKVNSGLSEDRQILIAYEIEEAQSKLLKAQTIRKAGESLAVRAIALSTSPFVTALREQVSDVTRVTSKRFQQVAQDAGLGTQISALIDQFQAFTKSA